MLHATYTAGKSNRYKVYSGYRDDQTPHVHEEDEVTSTVLGPLDFLSPAAVHEFWKAVFAVAGRCDLLPRHSPNRSAVKLWDSRMASDGGLRIEPDGRIDFYWDNPGGSEQQTLLIEVKWRARLSGEDQLHRQWCDYLNDDERSITHHVFIGIETSAGLAAKYSKRGDVWQGRLILVSWLQIRAAFSALSERDDELGRWATLADRFLEKVGIRRFLGFTEFQEPIEVIKAVPAPFFWHRFSPWAWLARVEFFPARVESNIFWFE